MNHDGVITPQAQAEHLKKNGHLEGESTNGINVVKYYTMGDSGYRVLMYNGKAIQVTKMTAEEAALMAKTSMLRFGGF